MEKVKIHYLYNSGFTLETTEAFMVFDYFMDSVESDKKCISNGALSIEDFPDNKNIIVFSSHSHEDHYNPVIFSWQSKLPHINYVLSSDIKIKDSGSKIFSMGPYEKLQLGNITVKSFGSTDIGVSYFVQTEDISIFHAGDLNWWYWWDDTEEELRKAESWFKEEIDKINGEKVDIAFFPVDPRLQQNYCKGAQYFIEKIKPNILFPMHFGSNYEITGEFKREVKNSTTEIIEIQKRGQQFNLFFSKEV